MSLNTIINSREQYIQDTIADFDKVWSKLVPGLQKDILRLFRNGDYSKESILAAFEGNGFNEMAQEFVGRYSEMVKYSKDITGELGYKFLLTQDNISLFETLMDVQVDKLTDKQQIINDMRRFAVESEIEGRTVANIRNGLDRIFIDMGRRLNTEIYTGIRTFGAGVDLKNFTNSGIQKFVYSGPVDSKNRDICQTTLSDPRQTTGWTIEEINASETPFIERGGYNCRHRWLPYVGGDIVDMNQISIDEGSAILERTGNKYEEATVFDSNGNKILYKSGKKSQVYFDDSELEKIKGAELFTHNHPSSQSFSIDDIVFAGAHNIKEIRAIAPESFHGNVEYYLKIKDYDHNKFVMNYNRNRDKAFKKYEGDVISGRMQPIEASQRFTNDLWEIISKNMGWDYGHVNRTK